MLVNTQFLPIQQAVSTFENDFREKISPVSTFEKANSVKMWLVSTFENTIFKILFFVSTFLDWYKLVQTSCIIVLIYHTINLHFRAE